MKVLRGKVDMQMLCPEVVGQGLNVSLAEEALLASAAAGRTGQDVGCGLFWSSVSYGEKRRETIHIYIYIYIYEHYST